MNTLDWLIAAILGLSVLTAAARGFWLEALSLAGAVAGYLVAAWQYGRVSPLFLDYVRAPWVADAAAFSDLIAGGAEGEELVRRYERRRRTANDRSIGFTRGATRFFRLPEFAVRRLFPWAFWSARWLPAFVGRRLAQAVTTAFQERAGNP